VNRHIQLHEEILPTPKHRGRPGGSTKRGRPKGSTNTKPKRLQEVINLRLAGKTLSEIAAHFGVTKQTISQQLRRHVPEVIDQLQTNKESAARRYIFVKRFPGLVRKWLRIAGYRHCSICNTWKCVDEFAPLSLYTCRICNAARMRTQYAVNPKRKEYISKYAQTQKAKEYQKVYNQTKKKRGHHHLAIPEMRIESPWESCLTPEKCAPIPEPFRPHGIYLMDFCRCGAYRLAEINTGRRSFLPWTPPVSEN
jgi:hypothetical protein